MLAVGYRVTVAVLRSLADWFSHVRVVEAEIFIPSIAALLFCHRRCDKASQTSNGGRKPMLWKVRLKEIDSDFLQVRNTPMRKNVAGSSISHIPFF